ncbi:hypothetical protein CRE_18806 [Caenorhabditis remanei]|uniref:Serpentine receptor class gamma n=1 Tax=Caenorhabditis remanei TaxID=31234 RepID=E3LKI4_CAERE|nr:hypothetical protein CRE_18806 [Caenorhabditis remanei]
MSADTITFQWKDSPEVPSKTRLAICQLVYGVPSVVLMTFMLIFLGCSKNYSSSFYRLVQVDLLTNIFCWLNTWISLRSSEFPFGTAYVKVLLAYIPWLWNLSALLLNFFFHMQFCSAASMSVHRISSILFFNDYEKFWTRFFIPIHLLFFFYSWIPQLMVFGTGPEMNLVNGSLYYTFHPIGTTSFQTGVYIFSCVYFVLLFGFSISVPLIAAYKFDGAISDSNVSKKLTRIALTYGFVYSGILFWNILNAIQVTFKIFPDGFGQISYSLLSVASDLMTLALPYILLIFDSNIKRDLRQPIEVSSTSPVIVSS